MSSQEHLEDEFEWVHRIVDDAKRRVLLERVAKRTFDAEEFEAFFLGLSDESDRALAVVAFAYIDEKLRELLLQEINPELPGGPDTLFDPFGPLGSASARMKVAAGLESIPFLVELRVAPPRVNVYATST